MTNNTKGKTPYVPASGSRTKSLVWTSVLVRRFWNHYSCLDDSYFAHKYGETIVKRIRRYLQDDSCILDYACGAGALTGYLLSKGFHVGACDTSPDALISVTAKYAQYPRFLGAVEPAHLAKLKKSIDIVLLIEIIEHVDDAELANIFHNVKQVLVPDGLVIVTTPNEEDLLANTVYCPVCNHTFHRWQHIRSWSAESLRQQFYQHGLEEVEIFSTDFSLSPRDGWLRYLTKKFVSYLTRRPQPHLVGVARMLKT